MLASSSTAQFEAARASCSSTTTMRMVEANIRAGMSAADTKADINKVYSKKPDFVAFNEIHNRADKDLVRSGYEVWRSPGRYIGANAVTWRTDRWEPQARGTIYVSNVPGRVGKQVAEWGIRYANWVTLRSRDGCHTQSVVSYHVAPINRITKHLGPPSVARLGELNRYLSNAGPVIMAGDLIRHYKASNYPRAELKAAGLTPTYDLTGRFLPTGNHHKATIDYIFVSNPDQVKVTTQTAQGMRSDHNLVLADLKVNSRIKVPSTPLTAVRGHVLNVPNSHIVRARLQTIRRLSETARHTPKGETIRLSTSEFYDARQRAALVAAYKRGVHVQVVTGNATLNAQEQKLAKVLGTRLGSDSYIVTRPGRAKALGLPPTMMLSTYSSKRKYVRVDADQPSVPRLMSENTVTAQIFTETADYRVRRNQFRKLAR
ncbi:MAG: hypothetical protein L0H31_00370 [Nocardioidaceae bacterium]|nr:hypothetical protein [Nocardioidaceae bacterium]